jgi:hypothetical protein
MSKGKKNCGKAGKKPGQKAAYPIPAVFDEPESKSQPQASAAPVKKPAKNRRKQAQKLASEGQLKEKQQEPAATSTTQTPGPTHLPPEVIKPIIPGIPIPVAAFENMKSSPPSTLGFFGEIPEEIWRQIHSSLCYGAAIALCRVNRHFNQQIQPLAHGTKKEKLDFLREQEEQDRHSGAGGRQPWFACTDCMTLQPIKKFAKLQVQDAFRKGGKSWRRRLCLSCSFRDRKYILDTRISDFRNVIGLETGNGKIWWMCWRCRTPRPGVHCFQCDRCERCLKWDKQEDVRCPRCRDYTLVGGKELASVWHFQTVKVRADEYED